jgi:hypothetical protein
MEYDLIIRGVMDMKNGDPKFVVDDTSTSLFHMAASLESRANNDEKFFKEEILKNSKAPTRACDRPSVSSKQNRLIHTE